MAERVRSKKDKSIYIQVCRACLLTPVPDDQWSCCGGDDEDDMLWYVIEEIPKGKEVNRVHSGSKRRRGYYEEEEIVKRLGRKDRIRLLSSVPPLPHTHGNPISCAKIMALNSRIYVLGGIRENFNGFVTPAQLDISKYDDVLYFDTRCPEKGWKRGPSFYLPRHSAYPVLLHDGEGKVKKIFAMGYIPKNLGKVKKIFQKGYIYDIEAPSVRYSTAPASWVRSLDLDNSSDGTIRKRLDSWAEVLDLDSSDGWKPMTGFPSRIFEVEDVTMHAVYDNDKKILLYSSSRKAFVYDLEQNSWSLVSQDFGRWIGRGAVAYGYLFAYGSVNGSPPFSVYACHLRTTTWLPIPVKGLRKDDLDLPSKNIDRVGDSTTNLLCINDNTFALVWSIRVNWPLSGKNYWGEDSAVMSRFLINCTKFTIHKRMKYSKGKPEYYFRAHVLSTGNRTVRGSFLTDCVAM